MPAACYRRRGEAASRTCYNRLMARLAVSLVLMGSLACSAGAGPASPLEQFTGTHTRAVWVQSGGKDPFALGADLVLMGLDSQDSRGERQLLPERASYMKPMITPGGGRVVFSRGHAAPGGLEIFVVAWDGSGLKSLGKGFAVSTWRNPADESEWIYAGIDAAPGKYDFPAIVRFPIDNPSAREVVWNKTLVSGDTFQVSPDGRHAGGLFPWPDAAWRSSPTESSRKWGMAAGPRSRACEDH
jgi:hypothetical protein